MKPNKKCVMCGTEYNYCSGCPGKNPAWKVSFCCEDCKKLYNILASYGMGDISKEEAAKQLKNVDQAKIEHLNKANKLLALQILDKPLVQEKVAPKEVENASPAPKTVVNQPKK